MESSQTDSATTVQDLKNMVAAFCDERGWGKHHSPKNLAISISIEAAELLEHFQWDEIGTQDKQEIAAELADVLIYCMHFANATGIDVSTALQEKLEYAGQKYPVATFNPSRQTTAEEYLAAKRAYRTRNQRT